MATQNFRVKNGLEVGIGATILFTDSSGNIGIGTTDPTKALHVVGDTFVTGVVTATTFVGDVTGDVTGVIGGVASTATALENARDFSITGDFVTASAVSFDGTGNVALAATIAPDSVGLGTYTSGDYVQSITGTSNEIEITGGTGEGSTPTIGLPDNVTIGNDLTITRDLQVTRNLNVDGNITVGGTTATIIAQTLEVGDADLILGVRTDANGNDVSTDNTANHGGIAIASTEGTPLVTIVNPGAGETLPATYKKIMWFKTGSFSGLGTDAWLANYAVGIGSTQVPYGTRLSAGNVQITNDDISVVRDIDASGIITASSFEGDGSSLTSVNATTLDSIDSTSFLRSDAADTKTGITTFSDTTVFDGDVELNGNITTNVTIVSTDAGSSAAPEFKLYRNSASPADADYLGQIKFAGESDTGVERNYAKITGKIDDATNGTEDGIIEIAHIKDGSQNISARWNSSELQLLNGTELSLGDDQKIYVGTNDDLQIHHNNSNSIIEHDGTGNLYIQTTGSGEDLYLQATDDILIRPQGGENGIKVIGNASVELYYDNSKKFETTGYGVTVTGGLNVSGVATATSFVGDLTGNLTGTATTATNLAGGDAGDIPYQSAEGTTTFVDATGAGTGQVLLWNGSAPVWDNVTAASGAFGGITVQDEGSTVGTANSVSTLNFVGSNIQATASTGANGVSTITMSDTPTFDELTVTGISTLGNVSGVVTFANDVHVGSAITFFASSGIVSATAFFGSGGNLEDIITGKIEGIQVQEEGSNVGTGFTVSILNFVGPGVTASAGIGSTATITINGFDQDADGNLFAGTNAGGGYDPATGSACYNIFLGCNSGNSVTNGGYNFLAGVSAGSSITDGSYNNFLGQCAGIYNTTGSYNNFLGAIAGYYNTTGCYNNFFGYGAGYYNTTGCYNFFVGSDAGFANTTGSHNTFIGNGAGLCNTTGNNNNFFGRNAGRCNTTGGYNNFLGNCAGFANTTGSCNTMIGLCAGRCATVTGSHNNFFGTDAGRCASGSGAGNNFIGRNAGCKNTTGNYNNFFGAYVGKSNTTGTLNIFIGCSAGSSNTTGSCNTMIGLDAGKCATVTGINNNFFGTQAGKCASGSGNSNNFFGFCAGYNNTTGCYNNFFGRQAGFYNTTGNNNNFIGRNAGFSNTTGGYNNFLGYDAGKCNTGCCNTFLGNSAGCCNTTGSCNTMVGTGAGARAQTGCSNIFLGYNSGQYASGTGSFNNFIGLCVGRNNDTGACNVFIGTKAGYSNTTGGCNNFFGACVGYCNTTGNQNIFIGCSAGFSNTTGSCNTMIGLDVGKCATVTGSFNNLIGYNAGKCASGSGCNNNFIGTWAGYNNSTGKCNNFIGCGAGYCNSTGSQNNFLGSLAGRNSTTGFGNNFFGHCAGYCSDSGGCNNFFGHCVAKLNTSGSNNNIFGLRAGYCISTGSCNNIFGHTAGGCGTLTGLHNNFFGAYAGKYNTGGSSNNFLGESAGYCNTNGSNNNFIGNDTGYNNTTGNHNTFIGKRAGCSQTSGDNNIIIGCLVQLPDLTGSCQLAIGKDTSRWIAGDSSFNVTLTGAPGTGIVTAYTGGGVHVSGIVTATSFESTVSTGTAPFVVASTTKVTNLNADLLDGKSTANGASGNTVVIRNAAGGFDASDVNFANITASGGLNVSGVSTFQDKVHLLDNDKLHFGGAAGDDGDLQIYHDGTDDIISSSGSTLKITGSRVVINNAANNENQAVFTENGSVALYYDSSKKFETTGIGVSIVNGTSDTATITGPTNLVIDPAAVGDNTGLVRIKGDLYVDGTTTQINSTTLELADFIVGIATTATTDTLADGAGIQIGPDNTFLYEYNSGTNPSLKSSENLNVASGKVYQIDQTERLSADTLSVGTGATVHSPGSNRLTFGTNGQERVRINADGEFGIGTNDPLALLHVQQTAEGEVARFRGSSDARYLKISSFNSGFNGSGFDFNATSNAGEISFSTQNVEKIRIDNAGSLGIGTNAPTAKLDVRGTVNVTGVSTFQDKVHLLDDDKLHFGGAAGDNGDLQIYHDGSNSYIDEQGTGDLILRGASDIKLMHPSSGETYAIFNANGASELYYDDSKKFETTGYGVTVTGGVHVSGVVTATSFEGDGSALTGTGFDQDADGNLFAGTSAGGSYDPSSGSSCYNIFLGENSGASIANGDHNIFLGKDSGCSVTTGCYNTFFGCLAGSNLTTGIDNIAIGRNAASNTSTDSCGNIFLGRRAGCSADGSYNIFMGHLAASSGVGYTGSNNIFLGREVARCAVGNGGDNNIAMGYRAAYGITSGDNNVLLGLCSGLCLTSGQRNVNLGYLAGCLAETGNDNVRIGCVSGRCSEGNENVFIGASAGAAHTTGDANIVIGDGGGGLSGARNVYIQNNNVVNLNGQNNFFLGFNAALCNTNGCYNVFLGHSAGCTNTTGSCGVFLGFNAGSSACGLENVSIGVYAGRCANGCRNVLIGQYTANSANTGCCNVFLGQCAGFASPSGNCNIFLGFRAGCLTESSNNVFLGTFAGSQVTTGTYNVVLGYNSGNACTSSCNIFLGKGVAQCATLTGESNIFLGTNAGCAADGGSGMNVAIGNGAARNINGGGCNVFLGKYAGSGVTSGDNNIGLGYASAGDATGSHNITIGDSVQVTGSNNFAIGCHNSRWIAGDSSFNVTFGGAPGTGIVTAYANGNLCANSFYGDGSNLTGISAGTTPTENTTNQSQYIPFYVGTSSTDVAGISSATLVFNPSTNRMGVGTDSPQATLHVVDDFILSTAGAASSQRITQRAYTTDNGTISWEADAGQLFSITNNLTSGSIFSVNDVSGIPSIDVDADGTIQLAPLGSTEYVGVGTTAPIAKLHVVGDVNVTGVVTATDFNSTSDARLKTNVQVIEDPLEKVQQINGVSFNWIKDNKPSMGVIADNIQEVMPELVTDSDPKTVNYNGLIGLLIECVKHQQEEINALKASINNNN